jgi:hypothetical protein
MPHKSKQVDDENDEILYTYDQMIRQRALDLDQTPLIAYPKSIHGVTDYEFVTGNDLNRLVDGGAKALIRAGITPVVRSRSAQQLQ